MSWCSGALSADLKTWRELYRPQIAVLGIGGVRIGPVTVTELPLATPPPLQHVYNEFTYLSRFLPSLFIAEHRDERPPALPW